MFKNAVNIEATVFSRGVPITTQFQVLFTSFTFLFKLYSHLFKLYYHLFSSCIDICFQVVIYKLLQVGTRCLVSTSCYNVLQVHVSTRSEMTYQHVRK